MKANPGDLRPPYRDPLKDLDAQRHLRAAVAWFDRDAAARARAGGKSWTDIGEAMGFADNPQPGMASVAEHAFGRLASDLGDGPSFTWRCPSCGSLIADYGPEIPLPDAERGHAEGCERFAADLAAWDALWDEADGAGEGDGPDE